MDWRSLLIFLLKGALQVWADIVDPQGARDYDPKEAPQPRPSESTPPQPQPPATPSEGWGPPSEQAPVTVIRIETDAGSTVAAASFVGDECFGITKVERTRQPGESRRVRRQPKVQEAPTPAMDPLQEASRTALRDRLLARVAQQEASRTAAASAETPAPARETPPRVRPRGDTLPISSLSPATLMLLEVGEPTTCVLKAA